MTIKQMKDYVVTNYGMEWWGTIYFFECCAVKGVRKWMIERVFNRLDEMMMVDSLDEWLMYEYNRVMEKR